jgi:hypothetical protein
MAVMSERKRRQVFDKCFGACAYCGTSLEFENSNWCPEHRMPRSRGGGNDLRNLVAACLLCNKRKRNRTPDEWREALKGQFFDAVTKAREIAQTFFLDSEIIVDLLEEAMASAASNEVAFPGDCYTEDLDG